MPPYREDPERVTYFAETDARGKKVRFGIKAKDRLRHMYIIGKTGMGKSTMLENLAIQDIQNGEGLAFIDPHGSTAERLLDYVPEHRIKDVLYIAPFDMEHPVGFNVMEDVGYDKRHLVVSGLMATFKKIWKDKILSSMLIFFIVTFVCSSSKKLAPTGVNFLLFLISSSSPLVSISIIEPFPS